MINAKCLHAVWSLGGFNANSTLPLPLSLNKFSPSQTTVQKEAEREGKQDPEHTWPQLGRYLSILHLKLEDNSNIAFSPCHETSPSSSV